MPDRKPRFDLMECGSPQHPDMDARTAFLNGYRHGWQGSTTPSICTLTKDTVERFCWFAGYRLGERDSGQPAYPWDERTPYDLEQSLAEWKVTDRPDTC